MHFVEYFECTLLLRMYTNGVALAALLALFSQFYTIHLLHPVQFPLCEIYIQRQHHRWRAIIQCVPFDLNSCAFRLMRRTTARLLQTASEDHKSHLEPSTRLTHCITPTMKVHCLSTDVFFFVVFCGTDATLRSLTFSVHRFFSYFKNGKNHYPSPFSFGPFFFSCVLLLLFVQRARK